MQRFLYPRGAAVQLTVTTPSGETVTGRRDYQDEFTVGLRDSAGRYRSWPASKVTVRVEDKSHAHVEMLDKYSDKDIHDLIAYLETLK